MHITRLNEKHGDNLTKHVDDPDVWNHTRLQRQGGTYRGCMYAIGIVDP